jgi:hypothetical protein
VSHQPAKQALRVHLGLAQEAWGAGPVIRAAPGWPA